MKERALGRLQAPGTAIARILARRTNYAVPAEPLDYVQVT